MDWSELRAIRLRFVENKDEIKFWGSLVLDGAKISAIAGTSFGLYIVVEYLQTVRAPLPITDVSAAFAFLVVAAAYGLIAVILVGTFFSPAIMCGVSPRYRRIMRSLPLGYSLSKRHNLERTGNQYILFHGAALAVFAVTSIVDVLAAKISTGWMLSLWSLAVLVGGVTSLYRFYRHSKIAHRETKRSFPANATWTAFVGAVWRCFRCPWRLKTKAAWIVFAGSIGRGIWCLIWMLLILGLVTALSSPASWAQLAIRLLFGPVALLTYCFLTSVKVRPARIPVAMVIVAIGFGMVKAGYWGGRSLYLLGIGGGIPVAVSMKPTLGPDVAGCLIVNIGGRFVIWPMESPTERACRNLVPENTPEGGALSPVVMLSQTDILRVSGIGQATVFAD